MILCSKENMKQLYNIVTMHFIILERNHILLPTDKRITEFKFWFMLITKNTNITQIRHKVNQTELT